MTQRKTKRPSDASKTLRNASTIERDAAKRRIYGQANLIKHARAIAAKLRPLHYPFQIAEWLLFDATPKEFRAIADALELEPQSIDARRLHIIEPYGQALQESDRLCWRDVVELKKLKKLPLERIFARSAPLPFKNYIKSPPTWRQFKEAFVKLSGEQCLPSKFSVEQTLKKFYGLPLAKSKRGRPREEFRWPPMQIPR